MNYPFWDVDIGYGLLMSIIAVVHVFVSHFAIGGGLYLVIVERTARAQGDQLKLDYLKRLSKFFVMTSVVFGALTGVAIWFIIGLLNPAATEVLIHNFVWAWAIEWTFFAVEILAAILYFYSWDRMSPRSHIILGWIYFASAWLSLAVINGIITYMLTPGDWLTTKDFWDGFLNPTYFSSTVLRTGICIMLAGLYASLVAAREKDSLFRIKLIRYNSYWGLIGLLIAMLSYYWFRASIPTEQMSTMLERMVMPWVAQDQLRLFAGVLIGGFIIYGFILTKAYRTTIAILMMTMGLLWFGAFEWFSESSRKPFVIQDYMYANAISVASLEQTQSEGLLSAITFRTGNDGADLFRRACRSCHTIDGYRPVNRAYAGTDIEFIAGMIRGAKAMRANMPPWAGTEQESMMLATHIYEQIDQRHIKDIYDLDGAELGEKVYEIRCGKCHEIGGYNDKTESLVDLTDEDYNDLLDEAGDLAEEMPAFTGDQIERDALIAFFKTLEEGVQK